MNETLRLLDARMSLRRYADRKLESKHRQQILHCALRAPTAGNMMLYSVVEVEDKAKKARLAETCNHPFIADAPLVLLFLADLQRWHDYYWSHEVPAYCVEAQLAFRTPASGKLFMACCDAVISAQNAVIAAESLGIGSCYIGDILGAHDIHQQLFDLPNYVLPITLLCFGYYPEELKRRRSTRFDARYIVFRDQYRRLSRVSSDAMMAGIQAKFEDFLNKKRRTLAEQTYLGFTLREAVVEQDQSTRSWLKPWMDA